MYGQTEASPRMSYLDWKYAKKKIGSIGKPLAGGKFFNNKTYYKNNLNETLKRKNHEEK